MADSGGQNNSTITARATAIYDYDGNAPDELAFKAGDNLDILSQVPSDAWYMAFNTRSKQRGLVPSNFIKLLPDAPEQEYNLTISTSIAPAEEVYGDVAIITNAVDDDSPQSDADNKRTHVELRSSSAFGTVIDDHSPGGDTELAIVKGNMVEVLHEPVEDWVWVKDLTTKKEGYIPLGKLHRKEKIKKTNITDALKGIWNQKNTESRLSSGSTSSGIRSSSEQSGEDSFIPGSHMRISSGSASSGARSSGGQIGSSGEDDQGVVLRHPPSQEYNVTIFTTADTPIRKIEETSPDKDISGLARLKCDKGSIKEGEEVEVLDVSNPEYICVKHIASGQEFYVKNEELEFTSSNHNKISSTPPPIYRESKPTPEKTVQTNDSPPLPMPPNPRENPTGQVVHGVARLKCNKEPGGMKKGDEVELLEPQNSDFPFVRHKISKVEFYIKQEELDFNSKFTPATASPTFPSPPIPQGPKPNVPLKPGAKRKSPLPIPPTEGVNLPPKPERKANSRVMVNEGNLEDKEYYVNTNSKTEIRTLLFGPGAKDGTFIVRNSSTVDGEYAISVRHLETVKHYRIKRDDFGQFFVNDGETFHKVVQLVAHYMSNGGLEHKLVTPFSRVMI